MRLRQAKKIRRKLVRRTLSLYGWEGCDRPLIKWKTAVMAAIRLKRVHPFWWWETMQIWHYEKAQE